MPAPPSRRLLLVGAGHAHLHLLRHAKELTAAGYDVHLLAPARFRYSGVASASATGTLAAAAGVIDVTSLTRSALVRHHVGHLTGVDLDAGWAELALTEPESPAEDPARGQHGGAIEWDVLSLNLGSVACADGIDVADDVLRIKPLSALHELSARIDAIGRGATPVRLSVIGGGPSGMELAGHLSARTDTEVRLFEAGPRLGAGLPPRATQALTRLLRGRGVQVHTGAAVTRIAADHTLLRGGGTHPHDLAVLATGLVAPPWLTTWGLSDPAHPSGGIPVGSTLQHPDYPDVYACGDCAHFLPRPLPKIGVYGVRQGPVLLASLLARASGAPLPKFEPQTRALQVLDLGGDQALAVRGRWWWIGRSALRLKRRIDNRWLAQFR